MLQAVDQDRPAETGGRQAGKLGSGVADDEKDHPRRVDIATGELPHALERHVVDHPLTVRQFVARKVHNRCANPVLPGRSRAEPTW